jgi:hypothetical protein
MYDSYEAMKLFWEPIQIAFSSDGVHAEGFTVCDGEACRCVMLSKAEGSFRRTINPMNWHGDISARMRQLPEGSTDACVF